MFVSYETKKEIRTNTECATVEVLVDGETTIVLGICRYVQNDKAEDPERPSADSFEKIASNRIYGYFGAAYTKEIVKVTPVTASELEKLTGVDSYDFGSNALKHDEWAKVIRKGSDPRAKAIADHQDAEFDEDCEPG